MSKLKLPPCPACGTAKQAIAVGVSGEVFHCCKCGGNFDTTDPNEGGDYDDRDPSRRMEREEARRNRAGYVPNRLDYRTRK